MSVTIDNNGWIKEAIGIYWPNLTFGRFPTNQPSWIVLHGTAWPNGTAQIIGQDWAAQSANGTGDASVHLIINKDGSYVQGLSLLNAAWGNSGVATSPRANFLPGDNLNMYTISIEHCKNDPNENSDALTPEQRATSFALVRAICEKYGIPREVVTVGDPSNGGVIRHKDCDGANRPFCPGTYPLADLSNYLKGAPNMGAFSNQTAVDLWNSQDPYFTALKQPLPHRDTGIFNAWIAEWKSGRFKGVPLSGEWPITAPDGSKAIAQNFGGGTCIWDKQGQASWL